MLLFLFDPTQHPKLRKACSEGSVDPQLSDGSSTHRQDQILFEAANRIRRYTKWSQHKKYPRPLVVVLTKQDAWKSLMHNGLYSAKCPKSQRQLTTFSTRSSGK